MATKKAKTVTKAKAKPKTETIEPVAGAESVPEPKIHDEQVIRRANEICASIPQVMQSQSTGNAMVEYKALLLSLQFMLARFIIDFKHDEKDIIDDLRALIVQEKQRSAAKV